MQSMIKPTTRYKVYIKSKLSARNVLIWHEHTLANACTIYRRLHPRQTAAVHATCRWDAPSVRRCHQFSFGHPLLHRTPDFIVNGIQIWAVGWPQIRCDEFWSITLKKLKSVSCSVGGCTVLLTDNEIPGHFTDGRQQFLRQQHFSVVGYAPFTLMPGSTKMRRVTPSFDTRTETITDCVNVVRVRSTRAAGVCLFVVVTGAYMRSFWRLTLLNLSTWRLNTRALTQFNSQECLNHVII